MGDAGIRFDSDCPPKARDGLFYIAKANKDLGQIVVGIKVLWVYLNGLIEIIFCLLVLLKVQIGYAYIVEKLYAVGL